MAERHGNNASAILDAMARCRALLLQRFFDGTNIAKRVVILNSSAGRACDDLTCAPERVRHKTKVHAEDVR